LGTTTVAGYSRSLSIALRRMRKFRPRYPEVKRHILWMHKQQYSYNHIVNTSLAIEHYCRFKGIKIKIGRPKKPKRIIKDTLTESEVSRILKVQDVDLGSNRLKVIAGKNKKDRIVNISAECVEVLIDYL